MMRTALAEARAQAQALLEEDPGRSWGVDVPHLRTVLRGLLTEIEWLLLREAVLSVDGPDAGRDELEYRLDRVRELHSTPMPHPDRGAEVCGVCAAPWPCPTLGAARGLVP